MLYVIRKDTEPDQTDRFIRVPVMADIKMGDMTRKYRLKKERERLDKEIDGAKLHLTGQEEN